MAMRAYGIFLGWRWPKRGIWGSILRGGRRRRAYRGVKRYMEASGAVEGAGDIQQRRAARKRGCVGSRRGIKKQGHRGFDSDPEVSPRRGVTYLRQRERVGG